MKSLKILLFTLFFSFTASCGFLNDEPVKDQDLFVSDELNASCELDPDSFGDILDTNIEAQIQCLENNFIQFSRYVRSNDRTTISEGELSDFVRRFFKENTDTIIQGLKLIFELNMLLLKDEADSINRDNITPLFKLLVTVNKEAISITKLLRMMEKEKDSAKIFEQRELLSKALSRFAETSLEIIKRPDTLSKKIELKKFLLELNTRLNLGDDLIDENLADAIIFLKRLFFGGNKQYLTSKEIELAVVKLPRLITMATDFVLIKDYHFTDNTDYYGFQSNILSRFRNIIFPLKEDEIVFDFEDLYTLFEKIGTGDDDFNIRDYEKIFTSIKKDLIGGDPEQFNYREIKYLLNYVSIFVDGLRTYEKHQILSKGIDARTLEEKIEIREEFTAYVNRISRHATKDMIEHGGIPANVDILNFVKTLTSEIDSLNLNVDFIDAIFGLKIAIAGGQKNLLTNEEMYETLKKLPLMASIYFDLRFINSSFDSSSSKKWSFLAETLEKISPLLVQDLNLEALEMNDIAIILKEFFQEDDNHHSRVESVKLTEEEINAFVQVLKEHLLTTNPESVNIQEIQSTIKLATVGFSLIEFFNFYSDKMDLAKEDPQSVDLFAREIETKAENLNNLIQRDLPTLKSINTNLNYIDILDGLSIFLSTDDDKESIVDIAKKVSPLKTLLLNGTREVITLNELLDFATKLPSYASAVFKLTSSDFSDQKDNEMFYKNLLHNFITIKGNLSLDQKLNYFEASELMTAVDWALNLNKDNEADKINFKEFTTSLVNVKGRILHGLKDPSLNPNDFHVAKNFSANDITKILEYVHKGLEVTYFNERTYKGLSKELENRAPLKWINVGKIKEYPGVRKENINSLRLDFLDSIKKYRHYTHKVTKLDQNNNEVTRYIQYLGTEYRRTRFGHVLTSIIKYVFNIALEGYTIKQDNLDVVDIPRINMLFIDLKPVLEEFGLWTSNFKTFGENVILLSDLFQNTSNGDNALGLDEGVEFVTIVLIASSLTDEIMSDLHQYCDNQGTEELPAFETSCYRKSLFEIWLEKLNYGNMFPKLVRYYENEERSSVIDFIRKTEGFARDVDDVTIPMAKRDFTLLIGAMLNIESTFVRFDKNNDNIIDTKELDEAFKIYQVSVQKMAELNGWKKVLTKTVFYYMVKNMKIPSTSDVLKYHFQLHFNPMYKENIRAKRLNIGALLYNLLQYRQ
ncbi:hypothetical protein [Halobacteriovorax marinus]|uniref:hypothetical protein n=1 Tax=Halobacteriovorax marinus TaxID=97084 RepID=UPI003A8FA894